MGRLQSENILFGLVAVFYHRFSHSKKCGLQKSIMMKVDPQLSTECAFKSFIFCGQFVFFYFFCVICVIMCLLSRSFCLFRVRCFIERVDMNTTLIWSGIDANVWMRMKNCVFFFLLLFQLMS